MYLAQSVSVDGQSQQRVFPSNCLISFSTGSGNCKDGDDRCSEGVARLSEDVNEDVVNGDEEEEEEEEVRDGVDDLDVIVSYTHPY